MKKIVGTIIVALCIFAVGSKVFQDYRTAVAFDHQPDQVGSEFLKYVYYVHDSIGGVCYAVHYRNYNTTFAVVPCSLSVKWIDVPATNQ